MESQQDVGALSDQAFAAAIFAHTAGLSLEEAGKLIDAEDQFCRDTRDTLLANDNEPELHALVSDIYACQYGTEPGSMVHLVCRLAVAKKRGMVNDYEEAAKALCDAVDDAIRTRAMNEWNGRV